MFSYNLQIFSYMTAKIDNIYFPDLRIDNQFYEFRKFAILQILNTLPADRSKELKNKLPVLLSVTKQTFATWCNASINSTIDIPATKLALIAKNLNVNIENLFNIKISTIEELHYPCLEPDSIILDSGLTI